MKIYEFLYCPCVHESANATMSLHRTKEGAEKAMKKHKAAARRKFNKWHASDGSKLSQLINFGEHESWCVGEQDLLD